MGRKNDSFDPRGTQFQISDAVSLKCGALVNVKSISGRDISFADDSGNVCTVDIKDVYKMQLPWPWATNDEVVRVPEVGGSHYVYFVKYMGEVVYIGKGTGDRYKHPTSGKSSCYPLNELHFRGEVVEVDIFQSGLSDKMALAVESEQILLLKPTFNIAIPKSLSDHSYAASV